MVRVARWTEYHVREIDAHGDAIDLHVWDTLKEARDDYASSVARFSDPEAVACSWERVVQYDTPGREHVYTLLGEHGDADALLAWRGEA